ncbi:unnamed protein product [Arabis nemorensis]|uniref:Uncharacterized protein n=1 Tax=Arabis nemorensis TaxID=586526 RepID=A0A565CE07_9BRAS|nr:unnamed protein product [Arabis nemorensis]
MEFVCFTSPLNPTNGVDFRVSSSSLKSSPARVCMKRMFVEVPLSINILFIKQLAIVRDITSAS